MSSSDVSSSDVSIPIEEPVLPEKSSVSDTAAPVPGKNSLEIIPFFTKDYANFNEFLRVSGKDVETQLQDLYNAGSLCIVTFSVFNSSQPSEETMVNGLTIDPLDEPHILKIKKHLRNNNDISNYDLFKEGFLNEKVYIFQIPY
jgi:hypothetical protein